MKNYLIVFLAIIGTTLIMNSCKSDLKTIEIKEVVGDWKLKEAFRDGKKTGTLESVYFNFKKDGTISTNFNASMKEIESTYTLSEGTIEVKSTPPLKINVERTLENELMLKTGLANAKFKLILEPAEVEE